MSNAPLLRPLRVLGLVEGVSALVLFLVAMPLKYAAGIPEAVSIVGSLHGGLFMAYALLVVIVLVMHRWSVLRGVVLLAAAVIPFGPFFIDRHLRRWSAASTATP